MTAQKRRFKLNNEGTTAINCGKANAPSRSVNWNASGGWLAIATAMDVGVWAVEGSHSKEVFSISDNGAAVERVRFHPTEASLLCSASSNQTVQLWDIRAGSSKNIGSCSLQSPCRDISWSPTDSNLFCVTEPDQVHIFDTRKLSSSSENKKSSKSTTKSVKTFSKFYPSYLEASIFSPNGQHLVMAVTSEKQGQLQFVNDWKSNKSDPSNMVSVPAHTGPIYALTVSKDGKHLASGGADAVIGLWDTECRPITCTRVIARCTKFTRSLAFSHDAQFVASSSEEEVDLAHVDDGSLVCKVPLSSKGGAGGADEISFHPNNAHVLACARCNPDRNVPPVVVARLSLTPAT